MILVGEVPDMPPVDPLEATRQLEKEGVATSQAQAVVTLVSQAGSGLATKADIERVEKGIEGLRIELTARMDMKIAELRTEVAALRSEMSSVMNRQRVTFLAIVGLMFAALRFT